MNKKIFKTLIVVFFFAALSSCSDANVTIESTSIDLPQDTQIKTETQNTLTPSIKQTPTSEIHSVTIEPIAVPIGHAPILDGTLSTGEWDDATEETFADGSQLFLIQAEAHLYIGIRTQEQRSFAGNVYLLREDKIFVLHSSAALGTAIYEKSEIGWEQIQDFTWQLRATSESESAQAERMEFLQTEGWLASNGNMGTHNELEYQIRIQEEALQIAVVFTKSTSPYEKVPWPAHLEDATIIPTPGGFPTTMAFSPSQWGLITFD